MPSDPNTKLACLVCRQRKVACDRRRPRCALCEKKGFDCQYKPRDHRPGLRAGYVSQLEKRLELLERRMDKVERLPHEPSLNSLGTGDAPPISIQTPDHLEGDNARSLSSSDDDPALNEHMDDDYPPGPRPSQFNEFLVYDLEDLWFHNYHPWFPILHGTSVKDAFSGKRFEDGLVRKAIMAVAIWDVPGTPWGQRQIHSQALREEVISSSIASLNLRSIQALLILAMLFWGEGKWVEYGNLIAMCKRMSQQLNLMKIARGSTSRTPKSTLGSTHPLAISEDVDREERLRTFWMIELIDSVFSLNVENNIPGPPVPFTAKFPCSDTIWALQDPFRDGEHFHDLPYSSGFSMCTSLCTVELGAVNRFQQVTRESADNRGGLEWQSAAQRLDERLTIWREEFVAAVFRLINTESRQDPRAEMEPFIVLTNCFLNMGVITLLQSQSSLPEGLGRRSEPWPYANHRCMYACENMAAKVRRMEENELKTCSPCLVLAIFVASRFYIVHTKCLQADVSVNLHSLAYSLHICSQRWPLAKMFEAVIRTAVAEHRTPILESVLPVEFYDLRLSVVDISPSLQRWADGSSTLIHSDI